MTGRLLKRISLGVLTATALAGWPSASCLAQGQSAIELVSSGRLDEGRASSVLQSADPSDANNYADGSQPSVLTAESPMFGSEPSVLAGSQPRARVSQTTRPAGLRDAFPLFSGDASLQGVAPVATRDRAFGTVLFYDYDSFMGPPDSSWANTGMRTGINFGNRLGWITERTGICSQIGASVGVYDWSGTAYRSQHNDRAETQGFLTYGFYRRPTAASPLVGGVVQDWSFNDTYGIYAQNPVLSQLRGQVGYATSASNEYGIMGATHLMGASRTVPGIGQVTWRPISYLAGYWHHKWNACGPDTWLAVGAPSQSRLAGGGSVGDYLVSASANCPLSNAVSLVSGVMYMHPSSSPKPTAAFDETWNFSIGISLYPGRNARNANIAGQQAMPLLNVANNGSFLVDTNRTFY